MLRLDVQELIERSPLAEAASTLREALLSWWEHNGRHRFPKSSGLAEPGRSLESCDASSGRG
jgi:hypothetical protein